ncbi:MAG: hypothetical protein ACJ74K_03505 [Actinomycetes bacterium]
MNRNPDLDQLEARRADLEAVIRAWCDWRASPSKLADVHGGRSALPFTSTSLSRDFRELYLLSPEEIPDLLASDGDQPRRDDRAVQRLRKRMCYELNSHFDFRRRLLELPGWEQFTALFLFFVSEDDRLDGDDDRARFAAKVPHEVRATTGALGGWRRGCPRSAAGARAAGRDPGLSRPASGPGRGRRGSAPARTGTRCRSRSRAGGRGRWRSR